MELLRAGKLRETPRLPGDDIFARVARDKNIRPPQHIIPTDDRERAAWDAYEAAVWRAAPPWAWCPHYVAELAREHLPRVLASIGVGQMLGRVSDDPSYAVAYGIPLPAPEDARLWNWRWIVQHAPLNRHLEPLTRGADSSAGMVFLLRPASPAQPQPRLYIDEITHEWWVPTLDREGASLIELASWLGGITPAKAAHRIARLCGRQRPYP
jgi:hypothetical protein